MTDLLQQLSNTSADVFSSRRDALRHTGKLGLGAALAAIPFLKPSAARAQTLTGDFGILNFALTLEYLERSFYRQAADTGLIPPSAAPLFTLIQTHEEQHVTFLRNAITTADGEPVDYEDDDFTFDAFLDSYQNIATLAQGLEDTGVRAYKGQAAAIDNKTFLTAALQIHSVEARHAAAIRRLTASPAEKGWIPLNQPGAPAPIAPVYQGEDQTRQGGVELTSALSGYSREAITEAFDETLTMEQVLTIARPFITGDEGDGHDD